MTIIITLAIWYGLSGLFLAGLVTRKIGRLSIMQKLLWIVSWPAMLLAEAVDVKPYAYHAVLLFVWTLAIVCAGRMP